MQQLSDPEDADSELENADEVLVTLTLPEDSDAFFTDGTYEDGDDAEAGDEVGDLTSLGKSITVVTDYGVAAYQLGIERSEDFDDDGDATVTVTAAVEGAQDTEDYEFSSDDPINGGEVLIDFADQQESSVVPLAPTTDDVNYDVQVTDQFGNLVGGETVTITTDNGDIVGTDADTGTDAGGFQVVTDFNNNVEFSVSSDVEANVTPTGSWDADETVYVDGSGDDVVADDTDANANEIEGDGPTAEFYEVDFAEGTYTLSQNGAETQPVGSTVIMTYTAVDQNGEPIEFDVSFFRSGPGGQGDGNPTGETRETGEDGQVSYVFAGTEEGTATVTAIGYDDGEVVPDSQVSDTVTFGDGPVVPPGGPVVVEAIISADSNGPKKDVVRFQVDDEAEGATVKLFKIRGKKSEGNKRLVQVREDIVPEGGTLTFKVADRNGNKKTRFIAKVSATEISQKAKSNTQKPR
ncbi:hypothetical protein [Nocardioides salarius]|uniref:hypothetical protein n=1 Tax=Nocardioides salarius TaxID=374513 RepID=UPI0030FCE634